MRSIPRLATISFVLVALTVCAPEPQTEEPVTSPEAPAPNAVTQQSPPEIETLSVNQARERGLSYFISDVLMGDPPGTVVYQEDLALRFRVLPLAEGASAPDLQLTASMAGGSSVATMGKVTFAPGTEGSATSLIEKPLSLILGVPGADGWAVAVLVSTAGGETIEVSNQVAIPYQVVEAR